MSPNKIHTITKEKIATSEENSNRKYLIVDECYTSKNITKMANRLVENKKESGIA